MFGKTKVRHPKRNGTLRSKRSQVSRIEELESRQLLTQGLFLQGTAFVDSGDHLLQSSTSYLSGVSIELLASDDTTVLATTTTDSNGYYVFDDANVPNGGLQPSTTYFLKEVAPTGYANSGNQILTQFTTASSVDAATIEVTTPNFSNATVTFDVTSGGVSTSYYDPTTHFVGSITVGGNTYLETLGQFPLGFSSGSMNTTFTSYCVDPTILLNNNAPDPYSVTVESSTQFPNPPTSATAEGEMSYLYNKYGTLTVGSAAGDLSKIDATALQLAIWQLEFGSSNFSFTALDPSYSGYNGSGSTLTSNYNAIVTQVNAYVLEATGHSESALYLSTAGDLGTSGYQSMIATGSYNFANEPVSSINGIAYCDHSGSGVYDSSVDEGIAGQTVDLSGTTYNNQPFSTSVTTASDGTYSFVGIPAGTYSVSLATVPNGSSFGTASVGGTLTVNPDGTIAGTGEGVTGVSLNAGDSGTNYNFGILTPSTISGQIQDSNGNPLFGVSVDLVQGATTLAVFTTGINGTFSFTGLSLGTYSLVEQIPAGQFVAGVTAGSGGGSATFGSAVIGGINLTYCEDASGYVYQNENPVSIAGTAYCDTTNSGTYVSGEELIAGATITLTGEADNGTAVSQTIVTDNSGTYSFSGLRPGNYSVGVTGVPLGDSLGLPSIGTGANLLGTTFTSGGNEAVNNVGLTSGNAASGYNFGILMPTSLFGTVVDTNNNPISGVTITITDAGSFSESTTTNANGSFSFTNLGLDTYTLTETLPNGYYAGVNTVGGAGGSTSPQTNVISGISLTYCESTSGYAFSNELPVSISGIAYCNPTNSNTYSSADEAVPGVSLTLTGMTDSGSNVTYSLTSGSDGSYSFTGLQPGTYAITVGGIPAGDLQGQATPGTGGGTATTAPEGVSGIVLTSGSTSTGNYVGILMPTSLFGTVVDTNNNPISGVTITITDAGSFSESTTTNANGSFSFTNLGYDAYTLTETLPNGYYAGINTVGTAGGSTSPQSNVISGISLTYCESTSGYAFSNELPVSISGIAYCNPTDSNIYSSVDEAVAGVSLTLTGVTDTGTNVTLTTTSANDGTYGFSGLQPGTYAVTVTTVPTGDSQGMATPGTSGGTATTAPEGISGIILTSGQSTAQNYLGVLMPSTFNVTVDDTNNNPLSDVTLTLTGPNNYSLSATTNASGAYSFTGLPGGQYTLTETVPGGYTAVGSSTVMVALTYCETTAYNFSDSQSLTGAISGTKYLDVSGEGLLDPNYKTDDPTLEGVKIDLFAVVPTTSGATPIASTTTDANGNYGFTNVAPGTYYVQEEVPGGYVRTGPVAVSYYTVTVTAGATSSGNDFTDYQENCNVSDFTNIYYIINGTEKVTNLSGNVNPGDTVQVFFTVKAGVQDQLTLVSYTAPDAYFNANDASQQKIYQQSSVTVNGGASGNTYTLTVTVPESDFQVDFVCGTALWELGPAGSNIFYHAQNRFINSDNNGIASVTSCTSAIAGIVYADEANSGRFDTNSVGLAGVQVYLVGNCHTYTTTTGPDGYYRFTNVAPGTYKLYEVPPSGDKVATDDVGEGAKSPGYFNACDKAIECIVLNGGNSAESYNLGLIGPCVGCKDAATITFWQSSQGKALIDSFNGGSAATNLGHWLATTMPNLYGSAGANLGSDTNAQVAAYFVTLFNQSGAAKQYAQVLGTALSVYATDSTLAGGNNAATYGFNVSSTGVGVKTFGAGSVGTDLSLKNYTSATVLQLLLAANNVASNGSLGANAAAINGLFASINQTGGIS